MHGGSLTLRPALLPQGSQNVVLPTAAHALRSVQAWHGQTHYTATISHFECMG